MSLIVSFPAPSPPPRSPKPVACDDTSVGHVLVFSFIQRFFPNFFPSTYTDRRQNLLKMYTEVEKKVNYSSTYSIFSSGILYMNMYAAKY